MLNRICRILLKTVGIGAFLGLLALYQSDVMGQVMALPDTVYSGSLGAVAQVPESPLLFGDIPAREVALLSGERLGGVRGTRITYRLFGVVPVKTVTVLEAEETSLVPGGTAVGITIRTDGVLIVGVGAVETELGPVSPGTAAGLLAGDVILTADGERVLNADHLMRLTDESDGSMDVVLERNGASVEATVQMARDKKDGANRIGLWVRDSTAGVGTLSFYDPETGWFAALGHPVSDVDTQSLLTIRDGRILPSDIVDVKKGQQGSPGELVGAFSVTAQPIGRIRRNTEFGIFGVMEETYENPLTGPVPMGYGYEAHAGEASLLATISAEGVQAFSCQVVRVNAQSAAATRGMVISITDERLLEKTGGIVQGMSGCPVLQDGKLIGIVTHVFVNDPTKGYCVYAEWMREEIWSGAR